MGKGMKNFREKQKLQGINRLEMEFLTENF